MHPAMHPPTPDDATATDPRALSDDALERAVADLSAQLDAAEHRLLTLIREMDRRGRHARHGLPSMAAWLGWRVGLGPVAAREKVRVAKALGELPAIDLALARGAVSYSKVRAMTRIATPATEQKLLYMATQATAAQLETICRGVAQVTHTTKDGTSRYVRTRTDTDGMVLIEARLHADEAALVMKAVESARDLSADSAEALPPEDRPAVRRRDNADALVQVAEAWLAGQRPDARPGGERHQLLVCVRADDLVPGGASAEASPTGARVPPESLRRLACDASVTAVTVDDEGSPLDVGRKTRAIPPAIRRALHVRDGGCRFPGCTNRRWLDAHHIEHWVDGGATRRDNLLLLCQTHHRLVHEGGFTIAKSPEGLAFRRPDGSVIEAPPPAPPRPLAGSIRAPRAPSSGPPNYHWAIGVVAPAA